MLARKFKYEVNMKITARDRVLDLTTPKVMGILNVTPDSFSDGGTHNKLEDAVAFARKLVADGADIIDIGGESTRPGAAEVSTEEELQRVVPVVERIAKELDVFISIDTSKPDVMRESASAGAHLINDIRSLSEPGALKTCAELSLPVCLMHMQGDPKTMQQAPHYNDLLGDINEFFFSHIHDCLNAGIKRENLLIDPGFGFGKTIDQNYELLARLDTFKSFALPVLIGLSRKSMIGNFLNVPVNERLPGSLALALYAVNKGASIIRVHDVLQTAQALKCWNYANSFEHKKHNISELLKIHKSENK
jgi:dihydropteroate synthase